MTDTIKGRNVRIEVALTFASAAAISSLTAANPGVATKNAHGIADGTVGYFSITEGMIELHQQAVMTDNAATNTFELAGLDTTDYTAFTSGDFIAGDTWGLIEESKSFASGGGTRDQLQDNRLHLGRNVNLPGLAAAEDLTISVAPPEVESAALQFVMRNARRGLPCLFRIKTTSGRVLRVAYGTPSLYNESLDVGGLATGGFQVTLANYFLKPNV